ncbi:MAG: TrkH family potassium uptake protein [Methanomicrobiales archaeon]
MSWLVTVRVIAPDIGRILFFIGCISLSPLVVALLFGEYEMILPFITAPALYIALGSALMRVSSPAREARLSVALAGVAFIWFVSAGIGALPFVFGAGMPLTDGVFEAMSGWTSTGLSLIPDLSRVPHTLLFWRSLTQWMGGIGIVAFTIAMANRSGLLQRGLYRSEARSEALMPSVVSTATLMWKIYLVLTIAGVFIILLTGVPLWDAVNLSMTAIATGGFTIHPGGIGFYDNLSLEIALIPLMIAGALPFKIYFLMRQKKTLGFFGDHQAHLLLAFIAVGSVVVAMDLITRQYLELPSACRQAVFMITSASTCTGFQNTDLLPWSSAVLLLMVGLMFAGGSSGSTAGGIKLFRLILGFEALAWWFRRIFVSSRAIVPFRHEGETIPRNIAEIEVSKNMLIVILFTLVMFVGSFIIFHLEVIPPFEDTDVFFDVVSALCNVGLSTGFVSPAMEPATKWVFILVMWAGRLEVLPVIALVLGLIRGFD